MHTYIIRKATEPSRRPWHLLSKPDQSATPQIIESYESRKAAITTARLLAGHSGTVEVTR